MIHHTREMRYLEDYIQLFIHSSLGNGSLGAIYTRGASREYSTGTDWEFLYSVQDQLNQGRTLTTRQGAALKRIYLRYADDEPMLASLRITSKELRDSVAMNFWRQELRVSTERRQEVRFIGDNLIAVSGNTSNQDMKARVKALKPVWRNNMQIIAVTHENINQLIDFIGRYHFEIDGATEEYLALCMASRKQISHFIATGTGVAVNVCDDELLSRYIMAALGGEVL